MKAFSRRTFLALLPPAAAAAHLDAQTFFPRRPKPKAAPAVQYVYIGTDTSHPAAKGIYLARFDEKTGQFSPPTLAAPTMRPVYLAVNRATGHRTLYATNEGDAKVSAVSSFAIDPAAAALKPLGQVPSAGAGPCYIALDATDQFAYVANYNGGTVSVFRVQADGSLSQAQQVVDFHGKPFPQHGPSEPRQDGPHPHSAQLSPDNRFLIVNDLGLDVIAIFPIDAANGHLGMPSLTSNRIPGSGPRHLAFHPNGRWAYGVNELTNRIDGYLWNTTHGAGGTSGQAFLTDMGKSVSTLDPDFKGTDTAAEIQVSPNGYYVYVSNRGENSLAVFAIDQLSGALRFVQRISCGGKGPRHFTLDPTGRWLICGNQDSASVTVFARDESSGLLIGPVQTLALEAPVFTLFL